jgi:hypothetical protein
MPDSGMSRAREKYRIYGLVVESELTLTSVEPCSNVAVAPDIVIAFASDDLFSVRVAGLRADSDEWIRYTALDNGDIYIRVNEVFEAIVDHAGGHVTCARLGGVDDRTLEAHLVTFAISAALTLGGEECLHATVVTLDRRAFGLLGRSGMGKSTLAAYLIGQGATLITDDMLRVSFSAEGIFAYPGPYRVKLFADTADRLLPAPAADGAFNRLTGKIMFRPGPSTEEHRVPTPLAALFWLGEDEPSIADAAVSLRQITGNEQAKVLTGSTMNIRYFAPERLGRQLRFAEQVARRLPIWGLAYRRDFELLPEVVAAIRCVLPP